MQIRSMKNSVTDFKVLERSLYEHWQAFIYKIPEILLGFILIILGYLLSKRIAYLFNKAFEKKSHDALLATFLSKVLGIASFLLIASIALNIAGLSNVSGYIVTFLGGSVVVLGLAFKEIGENFISGVILAFKRPFDINDTIMIDSTVGKVQALEFRYTKLKTLDGKDVYIPNSDVLRKQLSNFTEDGTIRYDFVVPIDKNANANNICASINNLLKEHKNVAQLPDKNNYATIDEITATATNLRIFFWIETHDFQHDAPFSRGNVIQDVNAAVAKMVSSTNSKTE